MWKIQLFKLNYDSREHDAVSSVIKSGWLTMGDKIIAFESAFSTFLGGSSHCIAVSNGTAALHMAILAAGVGPGDEVIIPALTFVADANVVKMVGATPILADSSSLDDWNISAKSIERCISPRTKAVIAVHYAGFPCEMPAISNLCKQHGLTLIEDVAHAPGASFAGRSCGDWGDISCFSFFSNKNLSIGEGGMVATRDDAVAQRLRYLRSHGMTTLTLDRHKGRAITYDVAEPGLNYRMDEMRAALGLVQLDKLPAGNQRRAELSMRYRTRLMGSVISMPFNDQSSDSYSAYHILPVLLPETVDRTVVIEAMKAKGIQTSIHYPPFWSFTAYKEQFSPGTCPVTTEICKRELTLPLFPTMTDDEVDYVVSSLLECLK